jgi:hypothetical protein
MIKVLHENQKNDFFLIKELLIESRRRRISDYDNRRNNFYSKKDEQFRGR